MGSINAYGIDSDRVSFLRSRKTMALISASSIGNDGWLGILKL